MLQTHWFYLYIPWFFPLALIALLGWTVRTKERKAACHQWFDELEGVVRKASGKQAAPAGNRDLFMLVQVFIWAVVFEILWYGDRSITDTPVYYDYASRISDGMMPYRDFSSEYPPVAMLLFSLPRLFSGAGYSWFVIAFSAEMLFIQLRHRLAAFRGRLAAVAQCRQGCRGPGDLLRYSCSAWARSSNCASIWRRLS